MYKVVLVEDEPHIRRGLSMFIPWEEIDCVVVGQAENAFRGAELIQQFSPDIAVVDIMMPGKSGIDMIRELRDAGVRMEFILLSGYSDFEYARSAISLGVVDYLLKPIDEEQLMTVLRTAIARIEKRRSIEQLERTAERSEASPDGDAIMRLMRQESLHTKDAIIAQTLQIIDEELDTGLKIGTVAERLNISESYLSKLFASQLGSSFKDVLTAARMKRAVKLLRETDLRVYEIATQVGYRDVRYFSNVFRSVFGVNPSDFRNQ